MGVQRRISILFIIASLLVVAGVSALSSVTIQAPTPGSNVSGTILLNATTDANATNVTFYFTYVSNGSLAFATSILNDTTNDTVFEDTTFDTTVRPDGIYNVTVNATNGTINVTDASLTDLTIDNTAPSVSMNTVDGTNYSNSTPTLSYTVTDDLSTLFSCTANVDGAPDGTTTNTSVLNNTATDVTLSTLDDGTYLINVTCSDHAGNTDTNAPITIAADTTAPNVTINTPQPGANLSNGTITLNTTVTDATTAVDNVTFEVLNGTLFNVTASNPSGDLWNASLDLSTIDEGSVTIRVWANDTAGNTNNTQNVTITVDRTAPNVAITTVNASNVSDTTPAIEYNVTDALSASFSCTVTVDGSVDGSAANSSVLNGTLTSTDLSTLGQGEHTYNVSCTDASGNIGVSVTNTIIIDTLAPDVSFTTPQPGTNFSNETITLNATVTDVTTSADSVTFEVLNGTPLNVTASNPSGGFWNASLDLSAVDEGSLTIRVWANDTAGNLNNTENVTITVDRSAPGVVIDAPEDGAKFSSETIDLNATITDTTAVGNVTFEVIDSSPSNVSATNVSGTWTASLDLSAVDEGYVTIRVWANDTLGNTNNTQDVTILVDKTAPVVTIETAPFNTSSTVPQIDFNVTDNFADPIACELLLNGTPYGQVNATNATSTPISVNTSLSDGSYEANVTCADDASNTGASGSITIVVDTVRPVVTLHTPLQGNYSDETITLNATATDALSGMDYVNFTVSNDTLITLNTTRSGDDWTTSLDLSTVDEGTVTITVRAYDTAGNNNLTQNVTIIVDQTDPTITVHEPTPHSIVGTMFVNVTFNGTGTGINTSSIHFDFENSSGYTFEPIYTYENLTCTSSDAGEILRCTGTFNLSDDVYTLGFNATDTGGISNYVTASVSNVTVNSAVPTITYDSSSTSEGTLAQDFIFINVTASVNISSIDTITLYRYDDGSLGSTDTNDTSPYSINHTGLADGTYVVNGTVNDTATNEGTLTTRTYTLDTTAPNVAIDNASFNTTDATPSVFVTASDATSISCELSFDAMPYNTTNVANDTSTGLVANASLSDGTYTTNVTCTDAAGNSASDAINVTIDTTAPTITFNSPDAGSSSNETNLTFNISVTGTPASVTYRLVNSSNASQNVSDWTSLTQNGTDWNATLNLSNLTEWNYTIEINTSDALGNERVSNRTFLVDRTAPNASLTCSDVEEDDARSCTCTATDNSDSFGGTTNTSIAGGDTSSTGTKTATCTVTDLSGLTGQDSDTFEVSSSGGSSSGGGGGGTYTSPDPSAKKSWVTIEPGTRVEITIDDDEIPISRISILVGSSSERASVEVEKLDRSPVPVDFDVYEVFDITVIRFENASEQTIEFTVPTAWIRERGLQPSDVSLFRHMDGEWIELETRRVSLANDAHRYEAITPGFSFFAIGTNESGSNTTETTSDETSDTAPEPTEEPSEPVEPKPAEPSDQNVTEPESTEQTDNANNAPLVLIIGSIVGVILLAVAAWFIFGREEEEETVDHRKTAAYDEFVKHSKEQASEIDALLGIDDGAAESTKSEEPKGGKPAKKSAEKKPAKKPTEKKPAKKAGKKSDSKKPKDAKSGSKSSKGSKRKS